MSPALFVLCTEGLSHLLARAEYEGIIIGVRFSDQGPSISHWLVVDDSLFLCKAETYQAIALQEVLKIYGTATGQVLISRSPQ